tara:strand:- start:164 stop:577 length:414 start_codon:yes stop_codon:yes gene_type:complete
MTSVESIEKEIVREIAYIMIDINNFDNNNCVINQYNNKNYNDIANDITNLTNNLPNKFFNLEQNLLQTENDALTNIDAIARTTKDNKLLLKKYLTLDNANNGKLNDIRFRNNMKLTENIFLILTMLIFSIIYVKKYN